MPEKKEKVKRSRSNEPNGDRCLFNLITCTKLIKKFVGAGFPINVASIRQFW